MVCSAQIHPDFAPLSHPSLRLRQSLCALRSPARRAQDSMLHLQSKFTPSCFAIHPSFDLRLALFLRKSPSFAMLIQGGVLCSPLVVYVWCSTPPTANAYTTRSCYARLPARFGHILLSCGVQFEGESGRGSRTVLLFNYPRDNNCTALRPYLLKKELGRKCEVVFSFCIKCVIIFHILSKAWLNTVI